MTETDHDAVGDLVLRAYEEAGVLASDDGYRAVLADTARRAAQAEVFVVDGDQGRPVATVTLTPHGTPYAQIAGPGELEFRMLAVDPAWAGRGLGSALVAFCAEQALARGEHALVLCVIHTNRVAIRLYEHLGFVHRSRRDVLIGPDLRLMVLSLDLAPAR